MTKKILVVEDEIQLKELVGEYLRTIGYETAEAENGQEALDLLHNQDFDIVVSDVKMPIMSGIELLKSVKSSSPGIPFIIMTGYSPSVTQKLIISAKADAYLVKPFNLVQLKNTIEQLLDRN